MRTVFQRGGRGTTLRKEAQLWGATERRLNAIFATVLGVATVLAVAGCRSSGVPQPARGTVYPGGPYPYAIPYDPRGGQHPRGGYAFQDGSSYWQGDHLKGSPSIKIDLRTQRAYFYKGQELAGVTPVSTGRPGYYTPAGSFRITEKSPHHRSNLYGDYVDAQGRIVMANVDIRRDEAPPGTKFRGASMPYFLRFNDAVGMHAGYLPGYPASSGCVRLPEDMARHFYANAPPGTPVVVVR